MKILVAEREGILSFYAPEEMKLSCEFVYVSPRADAETMLRLGADCEAMVADATAKIPVEAISGLPRLRVIHSDGVGFQGIDLEAARARGVYVCNCAGVNAGAVAEQTLLLMLGCLRDVVGGHEDVLAARQLQRKEDYLLSGRLRELRECTVGLVGYGAIARAAAGLVRAFGARVLYYKHGPLPGEEEAYRPLPELLRESDIVSLHLPVTPETRNIANDAFFEQMKPGAILINTARGELVDDAALLRALESGKLAAAGLDCLSSEPVQADHPLLQAPEELRRRILFSPHIGGVTGNALRRSYTMIWEDIRTALSGGRPERIVNGL